MSQNAYYIAGALAAVAGIIFGIYKLRPEDTKVYIESADRLVTMAQTAAAMAAQQAEDLRKRNAILDDRVTQLAKDFGQAQARLRELERAAADVPQLHDRVLTLQEQLDQVERNRVRIAKEAERLAADNRKLLQRMADLEEELHRQPCREDDEVCPKNLPPHDKTDLPNPSRRPDAT